MATFIVLARTCRTVSADRVLPGQSTHAFPALEHASDDEIGARLDLTAACDQVIDQDDYCYDQQDVNPATDVADESQ
jgi:hypothetical protein